jgi:glycosyltransferase involved in cell wall biosynthesis
MVSADCFFVPNFRLLPVGGNVPVVVTVHDLSFERLPNLFCFKRRMWHKMMKPSKLVNDATQVIAVSQATKSDVVDLYRISTNKVTVVYSGIGLKEEKTRGNESSFEGGVGRPEKYVLFLGTLEPRKNVVSVVRAYDAIAEFVEQDLIIVGETGWLEKEMMEEIGKAKHRERIHLVGFVEEGDKAEIYKGADLFVYPSLYEGFGFPPLEAIGQGKPVITSNNSSLPEIVGDWATLVDCQDVAELALVMKELLGDLPEVCEEDKVAVRQRYSWERAARETLLVIGKALRSRKMEAGYENCY